MSGWVLKGMGLLTNSARGVWALTDEGAALVTDTALTDHQRAERIQELRARYLSGLRTERKARPSPGDEQPGEAEPPEDPSWKEQLGVSLMFETNL